MKTVLQELISKFEEIKDLDFMVQVMILRGESWRLLEQEKEQLKIAFNDGASWKLYGSNITQDERAEKYYHDFFGDNPEAGI